MEEKTQEIEEQESVPKLGSGAMLSAARKEQKRSVEEIADELNLSITQIRTIELDQSEGLPEPTYVRGYIRSYANLLGLNPEEVLAHYLNKNWQKSARLDDMPRGIGEGEAAESGKFSPARVIVFLLIAGSIGFFWLSGGLDRFMSASPLGSSEQSSGQSPESSQVDESKRAGELLENQGVAASAEQESSSGDADVTTVSESLSTASTSALNIDSLAADSVEGADETAAVVSAVDSSETRVDLVFVETSWVDIRDEGQNRLAYQSYPAGESVSVTSEGVLSILIGNAKGVSMSLNGQSYDLRQHTEGVYAKFSVGTPKQ